MSDEEKPVEQVIAEGVFVSANTGSLGPEKSPLALRMEKAMSAAVQAAYDEGVSDPDVIRQRVLDARDAVLAEQDAAN